MAFITFLSTALLIFIPLLSRKKMGWWVISNPHPSFTAFSIISSFASRLKAILDISLSPVYSFNHIKAAYLNLTFHKKENKKGSKHSPTMGQLGLEPRTYRLWAGGSNQTELLARIFNRKYFISYFKEFVKHFF